MRLRQSSLATLLAVRGRFHFVSDVGCLLLSVGLQQRHHLANRVAVLQIPDRLFHFFLRSGGKHAFGERGEFLFHFLIRQRISRIAFGEVKLFGKRTSIGRSDV